MRARLPRLSDHHRPVRTMLRHPRRVGRAATGPHRVAGSPADAGSAEKQEPRGLDVSPGADDVVEGALTPEARHREGAVPEDLASYSCTCGYVFEARVSTSVHCPHCGDTQAW